MYKKIAGALLSGLLLTGQMPAQTATAATAVPTWVIAASPFSLTGKQLVTTKAETLIPTFILDHLSADHSHQVTPEESTKRKLALLQTQQQALFLELSAAVKKRDAAVLESPRTSKVKRQIAAEEKKIKAAKAKLDTNTHEIRLLQPDYVSDINVPLTWATRRVLAKDRKDAALGVPTETVALWKNNSATLYTANLDKDGNPIEAMQLEKALAAEKINALLTGSISVQDEYLAVSAALYRYPGGELLGTAMEIGRITNMADIARVLAFDLMPGVESVRPATLVVNLDADMPENFTLSVDSNTFSDSAIPDRYPVPAGVHQVSFEAAGYKTESVTMNFEPNTTYRLGVRMEKETVNAISLSLKNESKGFFLINGVTHNSPSEELPVVNNTLLGRFDPETAAGEGDAAVTTGNPGYFVVPPEAAASPARSWTVDPFARDVTAEIEKGRKSLYLSYTFLMISLPVLFVSLGEYNKANSAPATADVNPEMWNIVSNVSIGLSVVCGANFIWRLIRYMRSANPVIPVVATPLQSGGKK